MKPDTPILLGNIALFLALMSYDIPTKIILLVLGILHLISGYILLKQQHKLDKVKTKYKHIRDDIIIQSLNK